MREMGLRGAIARPRLGDDDAGGAGRERPADLVDRQFTATRPNQLWVADISVPQQAA